MSSKERKEHILDASLLTFNLEERLGQLKSEQQWQAEDRNAITLIKTANLCVILLALHKGARLDEHQLEGPSTLTVIAGAIRYSVGDQHYDLRAHALATLYADIPHELEALEESSALLTIVYSKPHSADQ